MKNVSGCYGANSKAYVREPVDISADNHAIERQVDRRNLVSPTDFDFAVVHVFRVPDTGQKANRLTSILEPVSYTPSSRRAAAMESSAASCVVK